MVDSWRRQLGGIEQGSGEYRRVVDDLLLAVDSGISTITNGIASLTGPLNTLIKYAGEAISWIPGIGDMVRNATNSARVAVTNIGTQIRLLKTNLTSYQRQLNQIGQDVVRLVQGIANNVISLLNDQIALFNRLIGELDPAVDGLFKGLEWSLGTARAALDQANRFLAILRETNGELFDLLNQITDWSVGGLILVREARFEGMLNSVAGRWVKLSATLAVQGVEHTYTVDLNFNDIEKAAKRLAGMVMSDMLFDRVG
jgi:hypothetical protein